MKDKNNHGLDKIPDLIIIKHLREELGKKESYILELEHNIKTKEKKEIKRATLTNKENKIKKLEKLLKRFRNKELILNGRNDDLNHWCSYNGIDEENKKELISIIRDTKMDR